MLQIVLPATPSGVIFFKGFQCCYLAESLCHMANEMKQCDFFFLLKYMHIKGCKGSNQLLGGNTCGNVHIINLCELR